MFGGTQKLAEPVSSLKFWGVLMRCGGCNEENALVAETCAYCGRSLLRPPRRKWREWLNGGGVALYLWLIFYFGFKALDAGEPWPDSPIMLAIYTLHRYLGTTVSLIVVTAAVLNCFVQAWREWHRRL